MLCSVSKEEGCRKTPVSVVGHALNNFERTGGVGGAVLGEDGSDFFVDLTRGCEGRGREEGFELRRGGKAVKERAGNRASL